VRVGVNVVDGEQRPADGSECASARKSDGSQIFRTRASESRLSKRFRLWAVGRASLEKRGKLRGGQILSMLWSAEGAR
jgi:hypothetical protein